MSSSLSSSSSSFSSTDADQLVTDRLVLRSWSTTEADAVLRGGRLPHWAEDFPAEGDRVIVGLFAEHQEWLGAFGHRQVVERESGLVVGSIGLFWPPADGEIEIGYGIVATRRGRGYASEATRALTEFALTAAEVHTVHASVEPSNPSSVRVLEKAGFQRAASEEGLHRFRATEADLTQR
ncbi:GNAT family N-acetyltransferase [Streptomyces sp. NPDC020802]|uniref:GNAT family N-acetyltransferase n=1 Tax=Streptomyces sp. NPDC020802 TaxID=3365094 RepID=UPI0037AD7080